MKNKVIKLLKEYLDAPEAWGDNVMIEVNPADREVRLNDDEDVDPDASDLDYWSVMDLLQMSVSDPGQWDIDADAVDELVASY